MYAHALTKLRKKRQEFHGLIWSLDLNLRELRDFQNPLVQFSYAINLKEEEEKNVS